MSKITLHSVNTKKDIKKFIKYKWKIYQNDKYWVPPLIYDKLKILDKNKNPFFEHAEMKLLMAERNGEFVGRIAAIKNDLHNEIHNENAGFFGFFECINDQEVADTLFNAVKEWLKSKGLNKILGPANPSTNDEWALLIDGFNDSPRLLMPYNPEYYKTLIEKYGFKKAKDLYAYKISSNTVLNNPKLERVAKIAKERAGVTIRPLNMKVFNEELKRVKYAYNQAWAANWGFVPLTEKEIDAMAKDLKPLVDPDLVLFGEVNGNTIGFALVIPDYNYAFKKMNGRLLPFGFLRLFTEKKKIPWVRIITLGLIPEYQKRGLDASFYYEIIKRAPAKGYHLGEASWILEDNEMMVRGAKTMSGELYKKYRVYELNI